VVVHIRGRGAEVHKESGGAYHQVQRCRGAQGEWWCISGAEVQKECGGAYQVQRLCRGEEAHKVSGGVYQVQRWSRGSADHVKIGVGVGGMIGVGGVTK
jgi:hypothetical protein